MSGRPSRNGTGLVAHDQTCEHLFVTSQGSPTTRFDRAIKTRNLFLAEVGLREMRSPPPLPMALDYLELLAAVRPDRVGRAAVRLARPARA